MPKTILAIGGVYVDINCHGVNFKGSLPAEVELDGAEYEVVAGGSGVNFGRLCKQLGLNPAFIGKVGDDRMGELAKQLLQDAGIRPMLVVDNTVTTQIGMSFVNDQGETVMPGGGNANQALGPDDVIKEVREHAPKTDYLYLGTCLKLKRLLPGYAELTDIARRHGAQIIVDHGRVANTVRPQNIPMVKKLVEKVDFYLPSTDEFLQVWNAASIEEGLRKLAQITKAQTIVKDGANGAYTLVNGELVHAKAFKVKARYMVGAGDAFNAGFIAAVAKGMAIEQSMAYACAVAGLKISGQSITSENIKQLLAA